MNLWPKVVATLGALSVVLGLIAGLVYYRGENNEKRAQIASLTLERDTLKSQNEGQAQIIKDRADVSQQVIELRKQFALMELELGRNGVKLDRAIQEVKENDQAVRDYLAQPVPDALGRLFVRPATTDPTLYRSPYLESGAVQPGSVPAAGVDPAKGK